MVLCPTLMLSRIFENKSIASITMGFFFIFFGFDGAQQYLVPSLEKVGLGSLAINSLLILYSIFFISNLFGPQLISILTPRLSLIIGSLTYALFSITIPFHNAFLLYFSAAALGVGATLLWNASGQIMAQASSAPRFGANQGLKYSALQIGAALGSIFGAILLTRATEMQMFISLAACTLLGCIFLATIPISVNTDTTFKENSSNSIFLKLFILAPPVFAGYFLMMLGFSSIKILVLERFGINGVALIGPSIRCSSAAGALIGGILAVKYNKKRLLTCAITLALLGTIILAISSDLSLACFGSICVGLSFAGIYPIVTSLIKGQKEINFDQANGTFHIYTTSGMLAGLICAKLAAPITSIWIAVILLSFSLVSVLILEKKQSLL